MIINPLDFERSKLPWQQDFKNKYDILPLPRMQLELDNGNKDNGAAS